MLTIHGIVGLGFGTAAPGVPSGSGIVALAQQDTLDILGKWGETLTVKRRSNTYNASGIATVAWVTVGTILGDWQPLPGDATIEEEGLSVKSSSQILTVYNANVLPGDRIYRSDGTYEYVNYIKKHEDHMTIRVSLTAGE